MDDRTMLELAARAAGIKIDKSPYNGGGHGNDGFDSSGNVVLDWHNGKTWNPLLDEGDRYRLLSKLKAIVDFERQVLMMGNVCIRWLGDEPDEARAIVRAAAEIGKGKEPS